MQTNTKKKAKILLLAGVVALLVSFYLRYTNDSAATNDKNLEIATHATNAEEAARQIAANNQKDTGGSGWMAFLTGIGAVLVLGGITIIAKASKNPS